MKRNIRFILYIYGMMLFCIVAIIINICIGRGDRGADCGLGDYTALNIQWTDADGNAIDMQTIERLVDPDTHTVSIFYHPQSIPEGASFVYRSKNVSTTLLVDGEVLYETDVLEHPLYNQSPGTRWNIIALEGSDEPQVLEMQITTAYDNRAIVDNFYLGDRASIVLHLVSSQLPEVIISCLIIIIGVLLIIVNFPLTIHQQRKTNRLAHLGVAAVIAGIWCLFETNVLQLFHKDVQLIQTMCNVSLALIPVPFFLYLDASYGVFRSRLVRFICYLNLGHLFVSILLHFYDILDFHQTLFAPVYMVAITITLVVSILQQHKRLLSRQRKSVEHRLEMAGVAILGLTLLIELIRYMMYDIIDRAKIIRIGILGLIVCLGLSNLLSVVHLIKQGMRMEMVSKLAYTDGLTNLNNRTAYLEQLEKYTAMDVVQLGIAFLDINNLKTINDTMGHEVGDELIITAANVMRSSFGKYGKIYRIGGDEFCVLFVGADTNALYARALEDFQQKLNNCNASGEHPFELEIAIGFAHCDHATREKIKTVQNAADQRMYENKTALKESKKNYA